MPLRITQGMQYLQALANIQHGASRLFDLRGQIGSGHRIQTASDDPTGAARILEYARRTGELDSDRRNISIGKSAIDSAASDLQSLSDVFHTARERLVQGVSGTVDDQDRATIADEMDDLLTAMLGFANGRDGSGFVFSGSRTDTAPFVRKTGADGIERVVYAGDDHPNVVQVGPGVTEALNIPGSRLIDVGPRSATSFSGTTGVAPGTGTDSGVGRARLTIAHTVTTFGAAPGTAVDAASGLRAGATGPALDTILGTGHAVKVTVNAGGTGGTVILDGGAIATFTSADTDLAVTNAAGDVVHLDFSQMTAGFSGTIQLDARGTLSLDGGHTSVPINFTATGQQVINPADGTVTHVNTTGITRTGTSDIVYGGTLDLFNAILSVRDLLRTTGTPQEIAAAVDQARHRLDDLDRGEDAILRATSDAGATSDRLTGLDQRLSDLKITVTARRSELEDADYSQLLVDLNAQDTLYQASLAVTARLSKISLANYL